MSHYYRNYWNDIKVIRRIKGGDWANTLDHGWIRIQLYEHYMSMGYNPGLVKIERKDDRTNKRH